jgi:hypothetical protein
MERDVLAQVRIVIDAMKRSDLQSRGRVGFRALIDQHGFHGLSANEQSPGQHGNANIADKSANAGSTEGVTDLTGAPNSQTARRINRDSV